MEISPIMMAWLLLYSVVFGIAVGAFYDANRIVRVFIGIRYSKKGFEGLYRMRLPIVNKPVSLKCSGRFKVIKGVVIFLGDLITLLFGTIGIIILNYSYNSGSFRMFTLIGTVVGFLVYYNTLGRLVMLFSEGLAICIKYAITSLFVIIGYPLLKIGEIIVIFIKKIAFLYSFTLEKRREKLYNVKEEVYLLKMSKNGFLKNKD